ncbi:DNA-3-methyladenine glycosylase I [Virgibacillus kimchii]
MEKKRCAWVSDEQIYIDYHDNEWGRPTYGDRELFEMLCLEGAQAGLSWITILKRRENYREAFDGFDINTVSQYDENKIQALMQNKGIIRNKLKVNAVVKNAQAVQRIQEKYGSFQTFIWSYVGGNPMEMNRQTQEDIPAYTQESEQMSKDLKKLGFSFVGPTICYAFMQATGMVNDHTQDCFLMGSDPSIPNIQN